MKRYGRLFVLLMVLSLSAAGLVGGPTWMAHALADGRRVEGVSGPPAATVLGLPLYHAGSVGDFRVKGDRAPGIYAAGFALTFGGPLLGGLLAIGSTMLGRPVPEPVGRDKWMTRRGAKKAGLLAEDGVICGRIGRTLLAYDGPEHHLVSGASRAGKGVGHVIPTLLCWSRSALVYDVKGELWEATAGYRSTFGHCVRFNPTDRNGLRYNPLLEVRKGDHEVRDAQNIAEMLIDDGGKGAQLHGHDSIWDQEGSQLLTAMILHVLYAEPDGQKNLGRVRDLLMDMDETLRVMSETRHVVDADGEPQPHPEVARVAGHLLGTYDKFRESVRGTATSKLTLWADPIVREVTSTSDLAAGDLMCLEHPLTLYLQPPPADQQRVRPLVRLMLHQLTRALMEDLKVDPLGRPKKHRLLLLLDEFPTLGRMEFVSQGMRQMAGYGIKAVVVAQSFMDVQEHYGANQTIVDNCHVLACFAAADTTTATRISQMTGTSTEYRKNYNGRGRIGGSRSVSYSEQTRPLLGPGDVRELPYDEQLLFVTGHPPLRCQKVRHFADRRFKKRLLPAPPGTRDTLDLPRRPADPWAGVRAAVDAPPREDDDVEVGSGDESAPPERPARRAAPAAWPASEVVAATDSQAGGLDRLDDFGAAMDAAARLDDAPEPASPTPAVAATDVGFGY